MVKRKTLTRTQKRNAKRRGLGHQLIMPMDIGASPHHITKDYVVGIPRKVERNHQGTGKPENLQEDHRGKIMNWLIEHDTLAALLTTYIVEEEL